MNEVKTVKVVMVGESGAGKSALLSRFLENNFEDVMPSTIGIDFKHKVVELHDGSKVRLQLWDTAGQERFRQLAPSYVRDAGVIILTFDKSSEEAIEQLIRWKRLIERDRRPNSLIVIVGNKCDLSTSSRRASTATLKKLIKEAGDLYMETSAKTGKNVQELFKKVARLPFPEAKKSNDTIRLGEPARKVNRKFMCC
ncbi:unnamed protein product [Caenorhabditis auriculariae]|uniref:Uncharacterized protein n=1 Tax=Caenorhabditis auriculariae TaxID=2777116 RepID=A0A8S1GRY0_9PELO|nr:unnamed protein product [Caenorhabditis auriculariae]